MKKMKLKNVLMLMLAVICFASCSDDDDNNSNPVQAVSKSYNGVINVTVGGVAFITGQSESVTIVPSADGKTVDVTLASFTFNSQTPMGVIKETMPDIKVTNVAVTESSSNQYKLAETEINTTDSNGKKTTGSFDGDIKDGIAELTYTDVVYGSMPVKLGIMFMSK